MSTPFDAKELMASVIDQMRKTIREQESVRPSTRFATPQATEESLPVFQEESRKQAATGLADEDEVRRSSPSG